MKTIYHSHDDGALYLPSEVDGGTEDGNPVDNYDCWQVEDTIILKANDLATGTNDILEMLLRHDPPLAKEIKK